MLDKKDHPYALTTMWAALISLACCIILSFWFQTPRSVGISIIVGELIFAAGMIRLMKKRTLLNERLFFLFKNIPFLLIPLAGSFLIGDNKIAFFPAFLIFISAMFIIYRRKFEFSNFSE